MIAKRAVLSATALFMLAAPCVAGEVAFDHISASDDAKLIDPQNPKLYDIVNESAVRMSLQLRNKSSMAERHTDWNEQIVIQEGDGVLNYGGTAVNAKDTAAGESRGDSINGGASVPLHAGDIVVIPAGTWHQVLLQSATMRDILFRTKK